jgi:hypothetical protein
VVDPMEAQRTSRVKFLPGSFNTWKMIAGSTARRRSLKRRVL